MTQGNDGCFQGYVSQKELYDHEKYFIITHSQAILFVLRVTWPMWPICVIEKATQPKLPNHKGPLLLIFLT